jgi:hypothetical protein
MQQKQVNFEKETFEFNDMDIGLILNLLQEAPYKVSAPVIAKIHTQLHAKFNPQVPPDFLKPPLAVPPKSVP